MNRAINSGMLALLGLLGWGSSALAGVNEWTPLGQGLTSVVNLVRHQPEQPNRLFAGAEDGLYVSHDRGAHWQLLGLKGRNVLCLAIDSKRPGRLYAGTQEGIFVSADSGATWSRGEGLGSSVFSLALGQSPDSLIYAGTFGRGVFSSADQGRTWKAGENSLVDEIVFALATSPLEPGTVCAGTGSGLFVSRDQGRTWNGLGQELRGKSVRSIYLPARSEEAGLIVVGTFGHGVWRTLDRGNRWISLNEGLQDLAVRSLAVDRDFSEVIYAATSTAGFFRTTNGGQQWQAINQGLPRLAARQVEILPGDTKWIVGAGTGGGVWEIHFNPEPRLVVARGPLDFGRVAVGMTGRLELSIGNAGEALLQVRSLSVEGSSSFAVSPDPIPVPPGETRTAKIDFSPQSRGEKQGSLVLVSDDPRQPRVEIELRGIGVQGELIANPAKIHFGEVRVGAYRDTAVVLTNRGNAPLSVAAALSSDIAFRVLSFQPRTLQPGQRMVVSVRFVPLVARPIAGQVTVALGDQGPALAIEVDGVGAAPDLALSPTFMDFGTVDPGRRQTLPLEIANSGNALLTVSRIEVEGEPFGVEFLPPLIVPPGQAAQIAVAFLPLTSGSFRGTLRIFSDAPGRLGTLTVSLAGIGGGLTLVPQPGIPAGEGLADLLLADLNQDGAPDLVVADSASGYLRVMLNDRTGHFPRADLYPGPSSVYDRWDQPIALDAAPILSSAPDLVVADRISRSISILENDGYGRFDHRRVDLFIGHQIADLLAADLDADGDADLAVANGDAATIALLFNDGQGGFSGRTHHPVASAPVALAAATFNADSYRDLVVANPKSGLVSILFGDRNGGFLPRQDLLVGLEPVALALADYDADGDNDLLVANQGSWEIAVLDNRSQNGETAFQLARRVRPGMAVADLALKDLTADIFSDLVAIGTGTGQVAFLENEAGKDFTLRDTLMVQEPVQRVEIADMNGDGANDLVLLGRTALWLFLNQDARRLDPPRPPTGVRARDVAQDLGRQIEVLWEAPELDEQIGRTTEYVVFRSRQRFGSYGAIDTVGAGYRSLIDPTATLGDTFYYYVTAGNAVLHSLPSDTVWAVSRPAPLFELQLVDEPRLSVGDTLKVRAFVTPADHRIAGLSLYLTFADSALTLIYGDTLGGDRKPFRLAAGLGNPIVLQNRLHPRTSNKIDLSLGNLRLDPGVEPVLLGELWFSTPKDTVAFIEIDDEPQLNRRSAMVEELTGEYLLPFIPQQPLRVAVHDYQVRGQVLLQGRTSPRLASPISLFFVSSRGDTLKSPLNDADRLRPGIQGQLDGDGNFRLDQIPKGRYQVLAKVPTHLQGRIVGDTVAIGDSLRTFLRFQWVKSDSMVYQTLPAGDANDDNRVNLADFGLLVRYYGKTAADPTAWAKAQVADFDGDGRVANDDLFLLADHFGEVGMELKPAAKPIVGNPTGEEWICGESGLLRVGGIGPLVGFSLLVLEADRVELDLTESLWGEREMLVFQWPEGKGVRVAAALRDPDSPAVGEGVLIRWRGSAGRTAFPVAQAEVLTPEGQVREIPFVQTPVLPLETSLLPAYPNPFNAAATIPFAVGTAASSGVRVRLAVFNVLGQRVRLLVDGPLPAGRHQIQWDGRDDQGQALASGVYFSRLEVGPFQQTRRLLLMR